MSKNRPPRIPKAGSQLFSILCVAICLLALLGVGGPARAQTIGGSGGVTIGILPFQEVSGNSDLGQLSTVLPNMLQSALLNKTQLVPRQLTGAAPGQAVDVATAASTGQQAGADVVVMGTLLSGAVETSQGGYSGPSFGGFHIQTSSKKITVSVLLQADLVDASRGVKFATLRAKGNFTKTHFDPNVDSNYGSMNMQSAGFQNTALGKATKSAMASLVSQIKAALARFTPAAAAAAPSAPAAPGSAPATGAAGGETAAGGTGAAAQPNLVAAKIDFIPGEKTIFYDDFSDMPPGEPPPHWKVRGGTVSLAMGGGVRELELPGHSTYLTSPSLSVPKNFTFQVTFTGYTRTSFGFQLKNNYPDSLELSYDSNSLEVDDATGSAVGTGSTRPQCITPCTIALWVQEGRLRAYFNGKRIVDVNQVRLKPFDHLVIESGVGNGGGQIGLRSVRLAESSPDPGTVLATTGKFVTHGIYFDTDSDVLKPESAPVIKEISDALYKNPNMKVEIDGYTDSTGDAAHNLDLSKRRAEAVMNVLVSQFGIDASRLTSNGFGVANPIASNDTSDGRAQNRRVEVVKQGANSGGSSGGSGGAGAGATAAPPSGSAMAAAGGSQAAKSKASPSGVELPSGTVITGKWDDGTAMKLKPPEAVALLFVSAIVDCQIPCDLQFSRHCSIAELVKGVKTDSGVNGLSHDPAQDTNYRYILTLSGKTYQIAAVPRRPGLGGWLFVNGTSSSAYHFNPNGPATEKNKKIADPGFGVTGETSNFERQ